MNPGGDYGKKELSPALRNRFTEIWVPPVGDVNELRSIATERYLYADSCDLVSIFLASYFWIFLSANDDDIFCYFGTDLLNQIYRTWLIIC